MYDKSNPQHSNLEVEVPVRIMFKLKVCVPGVISI